MGGLSGLPRGSEVRLEVSPWNGPNIVGFSFAAVALMLLVYIGETEARFPFKYRLNCKKNPIQISQPWL